MILTLILYTAKPIQPLRCKQRVETTAYSHFMKKFIAFRGVIKAVFISEPQYKIAEISETFILCVRCVSTATFLCFGFLSYKVSAANQR